MQSLWQEGLTMNNFLQDIQGDMLIVPQSCCILTVSWGNLEHNNATV